MKNIALLGHTGSIGSAIHQGFLRDGCNVRAASSKECNLLEPEQVARFFESLERDTHLVITSYIVRSHEDSMSSLNRNLAMGYNLINHFPKGKIASVTYLSSIDVYGLTPPLPITEKTPTAPGHFYGIGKQAVEGFLQLREFVDCPVAILRVPGMYGEWDRHESIVGRFLTKIKNNEPITIFGDGKIKRDYVEATDIYKTIAQLLQRKELHQGPLNVLTGKSLSLNDVVETLMKVAKKQVPVHHKLDQVDPRAAKDLVFDTSLLRELLPEMKFKTLEEGATLYARRLGLG